MKNTLLFFLPLFFLPGFLSAQLTFNNLASFSLANGAEVVNYDPGSQRLFVTGGGALSIVDIADPANPMLIGTVSMAILGGGATSVMVENGLVAVAADGNPGTVTILDTDGNVLDSELVGAGPDMLIFTPDGSKLLVANEGEPSDPYSSLTDPEGSVSILDIQPNGDITNNSTVDFSVFNGASLDPSIRIFAPGATVAQDLEPEYIAVSPDGSTAYVVCQENNAVVFIDIASATATSIDGFGFKNHNLAGNGLDPSDEDGIDIGTWPVFGMYQPDGMKAVAIGGVTYLVTANEGDSREFSNFDEVSQVEDLPGVLDPTAFPNAVTLEDDNNLGKLEVTTTLGDTDSDNDYDELYAFGARSFSIWNTSGGTLTQVFDSGDEFEQVMAAEVPTLFNADDGLAGDFDERSNKKGPEPEAVETALIKGRPYAFIGLEQAASGFFAYDISNPNAPVLVDYIQNSPVDRGLETLIFISSEDSPLENGLIITANEVSNTLGIYSIPEATPIPTMGQWAFFLFGLMVFTVGVVGVYNIQLKRKEFGRR